MFVRMVNESDLDRNRNRIETILYRLRPVDEITVRPNEGSAWSDGRAMRIWKVVMESLDDGEQYYRIYGKGPRMKDGNYVLMVEKPPEKGAHPAPEGYHQTPNPDADYREKTGGAIASIRFS